MVTANHGSIFRAFAGTECVYCDSTGTCDPPAVTCYCFCHADPNCDGVVNVFDVVTATDVAFRNGSPNPDLHPLCPPGDVTDVNCSGETDVFDVVHFVNVAFRNENPDSNFCDPCAP